MQVDATASGSLDMVYEAVVVLGEELAHLAHRRKGHAVLDGVDCDRARPGRMVERITRPIDEHRKRLRCSRK